MIGRSCRSRCRWQGSVKPSAQPTLVRTQHLPPAKTPAQYCPAVSDQPRAHAAGRRETRPRAGGRGIYAGWPAIGGPSSGRLQCGFDPGVGQVLTLVEALGTTAPEPSPATCSNSPVPAPGLNYATRRTAITAP